MTLNMHDLNFRCTLLWQLKSWVGSSNCYFTFLRSCTVKSWCLFLLFCHTGLKAFVFYKIWSATEFVIEGCPHCPPRAHRGCRAVIAGGAREVWEIQGLMLFFVCVYLWVLLASFVNSDKLVSSANCISFVFIMPELLKPING